MLGLGSWPRGLLPPGAWPPAARQAQPATQDGVAFFRQGSTTHHVTRACFNRTAALEGTRSPRAWLAQAVVALFLRPLLLSSFACVRGGARSSPRPRGVACRLTFSSARGRPELRVSAFGWVGWGAARGVRREAKADAPAGRRQVSRCGIDARRRPGAPALLERAVIREGRRGGARRPQWRHAPVPECCPCHGAGDDSRSS